MRASLNDELVISYRTPFFIGYEFGYLLLISAVTIALFAVLDFSEHGLRKVVWIEVIGLIVIAWGFLRSTLTTTRLISKTSKTATMEIRSRWLSHSSARIRKSWSITKATAVYYIRWYNEDSDQDYFSVGLRGAQFFEGLYFTTEDSARECACSIGEYLSLPVEYEDRSSR